MSRIPDPDSQKSRVARLLTHVEARAADIAEAYDIPPDNLAQLLYQLRHEGVIESVDDLRPAHAGRPVRYRAKQED